MINQQRDKKAGIVSSHLVIERKDEAYSSHGRERRVKKGSVKKALGFKQTGNETARGSEDLPKLFGQHSLVESPEFTKS
ncbi:UNVERIFIED_CONTAM: hypothetical protein Sindi_0738400 [Sesamum indicum]